MAHSRHTSNPVFSTINPPFGLNGSMITTQNSSVGYDGQRNAWRPRRATNSAVPGVGEKFSTLMSHKEDEELPMYKDKPYNYALSGRRKPFYRRRNIIITLVLLSMVVFYFSSFGSKLPRSKMIDDAAFKRPLTIFSGSKNSAVDWEERQERVRDAFQISWEAYEKHAWGKTNTSCERILLNIVQGSTSFTQRRKAAVRWCQTAWAG